MHYKLENNELFPIYDIGIISRDHALEYIELISRMEKSNKPLKLKKYLFYNDDPKFWVRNMMFFNPHFLNHIVTYWLVNMPSEEILDDFKKCLEYFVFVALTNIVGKKVYPYTNNFYGWEVGNFTSRDGLDLYSRLIYFGMEKYTINENIIKPLLMVRDCKDFIEAINNYSGIS